MSNVSLHSMLIYENQFLKFENQRDSLANLIRSHNKNTFGTDGFYNGPMYFYDGSYMAHRAKILQSALPSHTEIYYAVKANDHPKILQLFVQLGLGMDVVSAGELKWSLQQGCSASKIIFSGVGKTEAEILYALKVGIRQLNVESISELKRIDRISKKTGLKAPIGLRVNPDVDPKTHPYIATGLKNNKFGIEGEALAEADRILQENPLLSFQGFSLHIGSQLVDLSACSEAFDKLKLLIQQWSAKGYQFESLDAGGGLGIYYDRFDEKRERELAFDWGARIKQSWDGLSRRLMVEPGRWLVAHAGVLVTRVEYIKKTQHHTFAIVDTGMHHLLRPALYQAQHRILPLVKKGTGALRNYQVVGPICESSDVINEKAELEELAEGDLLAIVDTGAYGQVMSSFYNRRDAAKEIFLE